MLVLILPSYEGWKAKLMYALQ